MFHSLFESTTFQYVYLVSWCAYCIYIYIYFCCIPTNFSSNCHYSQWLPQSQCTCVCSVVWSNVPSLMLMSLFLVCRSQCVLPESCTGRGKISWCVWISLTFPDCHLSMSSDVGELWAHTQYRSLKGQTSGDCPNWLKYVLISKGNTLKKAVLKLKSSKMMKLESIESIIICQK